MSEPRLNTAVGEFPPSPARVEAHPDAEAHVAAIERGLRWRRGGGCSSSASSSSRCRPISRCVRRARDRYGSWFISDPDGRVLVRASREEPALLLDAVE